MPLAKTSPQVVDTPRLRLQAEVMTMAAMSVFRASRNSVSCPMIRRGPIDCRDPG